MNHLEALINFTDPSFTPYALLSDAEAGARVAHAKAQLGGRCVILCHHYQRPEVYAYADLTGDSLRLSRLAGETDAEYIVFCGVHFMAEVADILSQPKQTAILPDMAAGCSMADMADIDQVEASWQALSTVLDPEQNITPITYINSAANLKAFCGAHGGIVCTSANARSVLEWAFAQKKQVLFFPDQHLGRYNGDQLGIPLEQMPVWQPDLPLGGLSPEIIRDARMLLWYGHCSVHQMFSLADIERFRRQHPEGLVMVHPECSFEVCRAADHVGSTDTIIKTVKQGKPGSHWQVGTELNLVERLATDVADRDINVQFMAKTFCMCSTMQRIDLQHLAWSLEQLLAGKVVNQIKVAEQDKLLARVALARMLELSA